MREAGREADRERFFSYSRLALPQVINVHVSLREYSKFHSPMSVPSALVLSVVR